jgi:alginate O-acetyltransferase complex protein AlgI
MNFVSWPFAVLLLVVMAGRLTIGRRHNEPAFIALLIAAGAVFYAWHVPAYLLILLASTSVDYVAGLLLGGTPFEQRTRRRLILGASLATNLGLLSFFKYGNFLVQSLFDVEAVFGGTAQGPLLDIVLPIGISFYTFEAMSYTIDVYRGQIRPLRSFPQFFLFISFFPHLVAGPIVRAWEFLPQVGRPRRLRAAALYEGAWLLTTGYFLKAVCADNLAAYVNAYWDRGYDPQATATEALLLALMFSGQIFADFAGYSNIARGVAYLLGYRLPINFNAPYIATSFRNFWQRWHITLSRWLRDYLYVSFGGSRLSRRRTYLNLMLVMALGGLWHGAAYTFLVWGLLHGMALVIERMLGFHRDRVEWGTGLARVAWPVVVQAIVLIAWIFFRSASVLDAFRFLGNIVRMDLSAPPVWAYPGLVFLMPLALLHAWTWVEERDWPAHAAVVARPALAAMMIWATFALHGQASAFIYFQF